MKLSRKLKTVMVAVAAVFILAAPAYSWTHGDNHGWNNRGDYRHYPHRGYPVSQRAYWGDYGRPWYGGYHREPVFPIGSSFGIVLPGLSVFVGP